MQRLQSVSGNVRTEASGEDIECRTVSGDVEIEGSGRKGLVSITTVSGDVRASRMAGEVNGSTVSGEFTLGVGEITRSRLRSTSGDLAVTGQLAPDARVDIESISGDVRLDLTGGPARNSRSRASTARSATASGPRPCARTNTRRAGNGATAKATAPRAYGSRR